MKSKLPLWITILSLLPMTMGAAVTLNVTASDTQSAGLYNYNYSFSVTGGSVDNIYLGSADLSPLNVTLSLDNKPATAWSWLGNDTPDNYLQFFTTDGSFLTSSDTFGVTFSSTLAPSLAQFAIALNSTTGDTSPELTNILAPSATPEPASSALTALGALLFCAVLCLGQLRRART